MRKLLLLSFLFCFACLCKAQTKTDTLLGNWFSTEYSNEGQAQCGADHIVYTSGKSEIDFYKVEFKANGVIVYTSKENVSLTGTYTRNKNTISMRGDKYHIAFTGKDKMTISRKNFTLKDADGNIKKYIIEEFKFARR